MPSRMHIMNLACHHVWSSIEIEPVGTLDKQLHTVLSLMPI